MTEDRFIELETKLAHQEHLLQSLNDIVTEQQEKIMQLGELCRSMVNRMQAIDAALPAGGDEAPPHY